MLWKDSAAVTCPVFPKVPFAGSSLFKAGSHPDPAWLLQEVHLSNPEARVRKTCLWALRGCVGTALPCALTPALSLG